MDKRTLKSIIVELRDIDGKSFGEIADILATEYDTSMSRQAVHGMYKRATDADTVMHNREIVLASRDIVNYFTIGKEDTQIKSLLLKDGYKLSISEINKAISDNVKYIKEVKDDQFNRVKLAILSGAEYSSIVNKLKYKDVEPTEAVVDALIKLATISIMNNKSAEILAKVYSIKEDKQLIRDIISSFSLRVSSSDIGKYLNWVNN